MAEKTKDENPALEPEAETKNVARKDPGVATTVTRQHKLDSSRGLRKRGFLAHL
jgi:hypothetical protein